MKPTKKIILVLVSLLLFTCSKDDGDKVKTETLEIEEGVDINFEDLTAVTLDGESDVDASGDFEANVNSTFAEELPILFTKDDEIIFGYYSKTGANNTVSIDDMLLFFFTAHPEVAKQGLTHSELMSRIKSNSNYTKLKGLVASSLNNNNTPFKDENFVSILNETGYSLVQDLREYKASKAKQTNDGFDFKLSFSRDGLVSWPKEFPLFANVGIEISEENGASNKIYILDKKGLVASPGSLVS